MPVPLASMTVQTPAVTPWWGSRTARISCWWLPRCGCLACLAASLCPARDASALMVAAAHVLLVVAHGLLVVCVVFPAVPDVRPAVPAGNEDCLHSNCFRQPSKSRQRASVKLPNGQQRRQ